MVGLKHQKTTTISLFLLTLKIYLVNFFVIGFLFVLSIKISSQNCLLKKWSRFICVCLFEIINRKIKLSCCIFYFFYFFCEEKNASHVPLRTQHENIITSSCKLTCNVTLSLNLNWKLNYSFGFCLITNSVLVLDRVEGHHLQNQITLTVCVFFEIVFLYSLLKNKK